MICSFNILAGKLTLHMKQIFFPACLSFFTHVKLENKTVFYIFRKNLLIVLKICSIYVHMFVLQCMKNMKQIYKNADQINSRNIDQKHSNISNTVIVQKFIEVDFLSNFLQQLLYQSFCSNYHLKLSVATNIQEQQSLYTIFPQIVSVKTIIF